MILQRLRLSVSPHYLQLAFKWCVCGFAGVFAGNRCMFSLDMT